LEIHKGLSGAENRSTDNIMAKQNDKRTNNELQSKTQRADSLPVRYQHIISTLRLGYVLPIIPKLYTVTHYVMVI
jgi:hypothetical protein